MGQVQTCLFPPGLQQGLPECPREKMTSVLRVTQRKERARRVLGGIELSCESMDLRAGSGWVWLVGDSEGAPGGGHPAIPSPEPWGPGQPRISPSQPLATSPQNEVAQSLLTALALRADPEGNSEPLGTGARGGQPQPCGPDPAPLPPPRQAGAENFHTDLTISKWLQMRAGEGLGVLGGS